MPPRTPTASPRRCAVNLKKPSSRISLLPLPPHQPPSPMATEPHCEMPHPLPLPLPLPLPPPRSSRPRKPSFAASLLDAIYRSLDADPDPSLSASDPTKKTTRSEPHLAPVAAEAKPRPSSASSSAPSDSSSFGFSSDAEPPRPRSAPRRAPLRPDPPPATPPRPKPTKPSSIRSRIRDFRKGRGAPSSPAAPLACLLRAIFSSAGIARKHKPKATAPPPPPPPPPPQSRSVRFGAVSVVGEDERVPGDADPEAAAARRKRVEELVRAMRGEEEEEEEEESSDSSSDLFELENLAAIGRDELPVYETTHPCTINRSSAQGLLTT